MPLRILVAGMLPHDSGKTWLTAAMVSALRQGGAKAAAYKPIGGFSAWHHYGALRASIRDGVLAGGDARAYHGLTGHPLEKLNPIAYATVPPDPMQLRPTRYMLLLENASSVTALWRVTSCRGKQGIHYYSRTVMELAPPRIRDVISDAVRRLDAVASDANMFYSNLDRGHYDEALESCRVYMERHADIAFTESFNNAAVPYRGLDLCVFDFYVVVAPGAAMLYSGERVCNAAKIVGTYRTDKIVSMLPRPLLYEPLPPATSMEELAEDLTRTRLYELLSMSV